ncbi:hypothetical protein [Marinicauda pacifica]|uniref:hypothetical protein n=1 Tax=Marinicauda pacifica TaxID=1133559 RepID=UPI0035C7B614
MLIQKPNDLKRLVRGGCSPRVLDLYGLHQRFPDLKESPKPLFHNDRLNRCFLIKHNLRRHEASFVYSRRSIVTKLVLPIDRHDLNLGAFWMFLESGNFETRLVEFMGRLDGPEDDPTLNEQFIDDMETLQILSRSPSFDPYLLKVQFGSREIDPRFLTLNHHDEPQLRAFVFEHMAEIGQLATSGKTSQKKSERLAKVLFEEAESQARDQLRYALHMVESEFNEGVYGWKGILYYMWSADTLARSLTQLLTDLATLEREDRVYRHRPLQRPIINMRDCIRVRWDELKQARMTYLETVARFVRDGEPQSMCTLLLRAPDLFRSIGDHVAALTHLTTYWTYWKRQNRLGRVTHEDACQLLPSLSSAIAREDDAASVDWAEFATFQRLRTG